MQESIDITPDDASSICLECGMCCRGVIHDHALALTDEIDFLEGLGLEVIMQKAYPSFRLPCHLIDEANYCTIYGNRPAVCGRYQCGLLDEFHEGKTSKSEAIDLVRQAVKLEKEIEREISSIPGGAPLWERLKVFTDQGERDSGPVEFRRKFGSLLIKAKILTALCGRFSPEGFDPHNERTPLV